MGTVDTYQEAGSVMAEALPSIARRIEVPELHEFPTGANYRFPSKSIEAALLQKLARVVSGLNASIVLLEAGYVQEVAALHRVLDEFCEDILFLCIPGLGGDRSALHDQYLEWFYQEEFDEHGDPLRSEQKRGLVSRNRIRAAIAAWQTGFLNPSDGQELLRTVGKTFSGFVHGASPQIMEMYGGRPARFHVNGMLGTPRIEEYERSLWHYFHRALNCFGLVANFVGCDRVDADIRRFRERFEAETGRSVGRSAEEVLKEAKRRARESD